MAKKAENNTEKEIEVVVKPSEEERILGAKETTKKVKQVNYTALERRYYVKNILKNREYELNGYEIGAILGSNEKAIDQLKEGAKKVVVKDRKGVERYIIEVLK